MYSLRLFAALVLWALAAGCVKNIIPLEPIPAFPPPGTWSAYDTSYTASLSQWYRNYDSLDVIVFATDTTWENSINIEFYKRPVKAGKYKLVYKPDADDEAAIEEWQKGQGHSGSDEEMGGTLHVTVENGKFSFKAAGLELEHYTFVVNYNIDCSLNLTEF